MIQPAAVHLIKRVESWLLETNPRDEIIIENFSNQAWGACLRPCNAFLSLHTYPESCETPGEGAIYINFLKDLHSRKHF
jgi:hypothetical protein